MTGGNVVASVALSDKLFHKTAPPIIGKHSGDKESAVNITANMHDHDLLAISFEN